MEIARVLANPAVDSVVSVNHKVSSATLRDDDGATIRSGRVAFVPPLETLKLARRVFGFGDRTGRTVKFESRSGRKALVDQAIEHGLGRRILRLAMMLQARIDVAPKVVSGSSRIGRGHSDG